MFRQLIVYRAVFPQYGLPVLEDAAEDGGGILPN